MKNTILIKSFYFLVVLLFLTLMPNQFKAQAMANQWSAISGDFADWAPHISDFSNKIIAFNPSTNELYVAYSDYDNSGKITVKKFSNSIWSVVGTEGFSDNKVGEISLAFNPATSEPYVLYYDNYPSYPNLAISVVKKFNGSAWVSVGSPIGTTPNLNSSMGLEFNPSTNQPYVVYSDSSVKNGYDKATVKKFDGSNWVIVGTAGFSYSSAYGLSLAFNPTTNEPWVSYYDDNIAHVQKFNGTSWEYAGNFLSELADKQTFLVFNPSNSQPYVSIAYSSWQSGIGYGPRVFKLNGSNWVQVGSSIIDSGLASVGYLAFNSKTSEPYIAYVDKSIGDDTYKITVKYYYGGSSWNVVGSSGFNRASGGGYYKDIPVNLIFNPVTNEPFVIFNDMSGHKIMKFNSNQVSAPIANPSGGEIKTPIDLSSETSGAQIYYTVDGSTPTRSSRLYSSNILLLENTTVKAIAVKDGMSDSDVMSETYTSPASQCTIVGDIDCNKSIEIGDVQTATNLFLGIETDGTKKGRADFNNDGNISIDEIQKVVNAFLGIGA